MTGHSQIPSKKPRLFSSCFNRAGDKAKIWLLRWKKSLIVLRSLWPDDMDIETTDVFQNNHRRGTDQKGYLFWLAEALTKTDVNRRLLIDFF